MSTYFTYILTCSDGTYYIGKTTNLENRLEQHNGIRTGGAKYTKGRRPVTISYVEQYTNHTDAAQREYQMKQLTRAQKKCLIQNQKNPL